MRMPQVGADGGRFPLTDLVLAVHPFGVASARFTAAAVRAGGLGVLDLTAEDRLAQEQLGLAVEWTRSGFGVRLAGCPRRHSEGPSRLRPYRGARHGGDGERRRLPRTPRAGRSDLLRRGAGSRGGRCARADRARPRGRMGGAAS